jgi:glycine/D-amino acid oxidase-like deaminating enzyme/nitrite reductase/ring-hydroxylating ferredoxin subunit
LSCSFTLASRVLGIRQSTSECTSGLQITSDVLVIGGGISGMTSAYCLAKNGRKVVLIEDGSIGSGESGRSTAHLSCELDDFYFEIEKNFDIDVSKLVAESQIAAIEWIAKTVAHHKIDCDFKRVDGYLFAHTSDNQDTLQKEFEATKRAGIITTMLDSIPFIASEDGKSCLKFPNQAQLHIMKYLKALANILLKMDVRIYTETKGENVTKDGATANGFKIKAKHIIIATHSPFNDRVTMHTKQWPYRSYVIAGGISKGLLPYAMWFDTGDQNSKWLSKPYHYARLHQFNERYDMFICGGEDHKTGQADDENIKEENRYHKLEKWAKEHFPDLQAIEYRWSGQILESIDSLPFIGKNPGDENIYIITGDSGSGITNGTLGGIIINDLISGKENTWSRIYDPSRKTLSTVGNYLHEVGRMLVQYGDWFTKEDIKSVEELKKGEGGIISHGLQKIAAYRDLENNVHTCNAICPHLGGILQWNAYEKTFDCPLHGSRFTYDGKVVNGPACANLKSIKMDRKE